MILLIVCMNIVLFFEDDRSSQDEFVFYKNDERYSHITKILNLGVGSSFKCGMLKAKQGRGIITKLNPEELIFAFEELSESLPLLPIHLILGAARPIQLKRLLKDVSTIGISSIHIVATLLGEKSYFHSTLMESDNIKKYLIEGASQGGSTLIPSYKTYHSLQDFLRSENAPKNSDIKIVFDLVSSNQDLVNKELCNFRNKIQERNIYLAIGSERGWASEERKRFREHNFCSIKLGDRILRTETATIASLSYILSKIGIY